MARDDLMFTSVCAVVNQLKLRRRGCRSGERVRWRQLYGKSCMESPPTTTLGIPTVIGRRICLLTNSQYGSRRPDVHVRVLRAVQEEEKSPSFIMGTEVGMQPDANCSVPISVIVGIRSAVQQNHVRVVPLARNLVKIPVTNRPTAVALKVWSYQHVLGQEQNCDTGTLHRT